MKKKLFDIHLFREALRQLRGLSFLFLGLNGIFAIFYPILYGTQRAASDAAGTGPVFLPDLQPILFTGFLLAAPLMTLRIFRFTTLRSGSDFYHAMPQSRSCVFFSFFAAVLTVLAVLHFGSALLAAASASFFPDVLHFSLGSFLEFALTMFVASALASAMAACACFLTGNTFSCVLVLVLSFAPRLILWLLTDTVYSSVPVLMNNYEPLLLSWRANLIINILLGIIIRGELSLNFPDFYNGTILLYNILLTACFTLLAARLAARRKSEAAETGLSGRGARTALALLLSFAALLPLILKLYDSFVKNEPFGASYLLLIPAAALVFFGTEAVSERSAASAAKRLPFLAILPLLAALAYGGMRLGYDRTVSFRPEASELSYVRYISGWADWEHSGELAQDYFAKEQEEIRFTDQETLTQVASALKNNLEDAGIAYHPYGICYVAIAEGGTERVRQLYLTREEFEAMIAAQRKNPEYQQIYRQLPAAEENEVYIRVDRLTEEVSRQIYGIARQEALAMDPAAWTAYYLEGESGTVLPGFIACQLMQNGIWKSFTLPLGPQLPESWRLYLEEEEKVHKPLRDDLISLLDELLADENGMRYDYADFNLHYADENGIRYLDWIWQEDAASQEEAGGISKEKIAALRDFLKGAKETSLAEQKATLYVSLTALGSRDGVNSLSAYFAPDSLPEWLEEMFRSEDGPAGYK